MAEQIIMPKADWVAGLNKIRERGGAAGPIKSGEFETSVDKIPKVKPEQEKTISIVSNGTTDLMPSLNNVFSRVVINVNVPLPKYRNAEEVKY